VQASFSEAPLSASLLSLYESVSVVKRGVDFFAIKQSELQRCGVLTSGDGRKPLQCALNFFEDFFFGTLHCGELCPRIG
jgi:hypothetical protein